MGKVVKVALAMAATLVTIVEAVTFELTRDTDRPESESESETQTSNPPAEQEGGSE